MAQFDNYSSHLGIFEKIFSTFEINTVLEFGLGSYSSPFFAGHAKQVLSVEQESREWFDKMGREIQAANWTSVYEPDPWKVFAKAKMQGTSYDMVFSDGKADTRCLVANLAMTLDVPFIVLHDAERVWYYKWNLLDIPEHYSRFNFCHRAGGRKITTILASKHEDEIDQWRIPEHDRVVLCYSSPRQPIFQLPYRGDRVSRESIRTEMMAA